MIVVYKVVQMIGGTKWESKVYLEKKKAEWRLERMAKNKDIQGNYEVEMQLVDKIKMPCKFLAKDLGVQMRKRGTGGFKIKLKPLYNVRKYDGGTIYGWARYEGRSIKMIYNPEFSRFESTKEWSFLTKTTLESKR